MAQLAAAPGLNSLAGLDARMAALAKLEKLNEDMEAIEARRRSNAALKRAIKAWRRATSSRAAQLVARSHRTTTTRTPRPSMCSAMSLERMGHQHKALVTYERAFAARSRRSGASDQSGPHRLEHEAASTARRRCSSSTSPPVPNSPLGYNNLGTHPERSGRCRHRHRNPARRDLSHAEGSRCCGIRWPPCWPRTAAPRRAWSSTAKPSASIPISRGSITIIGYAFSHLGMLDHALEAYDEALARAVEFTEKHGRPPFAQHLPDRHGPDRGRLPRIRDPQRPAFPRLCASHDQGAAVERRAARRQSAS